MGLYTYGLGLGAGLLLRGNVRDALPYLIRPVNYWRAVEYQLVTQAADFRKGQRVLDIGSPKLLSVYLADRVGAEVYATDIESYFMGKMERVRHLRRLPPERYHLQVEDGRKLSFPEAFFDRVYAISVVEHIPDEGDTACIQEMRRVLKPGGQCLITVPFSPASRIDYKDSFYWAGSSKQEADGRVFYQRRYNEEDIYNRLISPSGMRLHMLRYVGENVMVHSSEELSDRLPLLSAPFQPLLSRLFHTPPVEDWRTLKKPLCAFLVLEKP